MTGGEILLRDARREEVPEIVALLADDVLGRARENTDGVVSSGYYDAYDGLDTNNRVLVAELDGEIVGTLQITFIVGLSLRASKRAQIEAVRVSSRHRGRGVGEEMLAQAIELARSEGCALIQLTTNKAREDAHRFYERLGFVATHEGMKLALD